MTRELLALAHHRWHCTHEIDSGTCVALEITKGES